MTKRTVNTLGLALSAVLWAPSTLWCGAPPAASKPMEARPAATAPADGLIDLGKGDLGKLRQAFNDNQGNVRMLFILSPTCPGCLEGSLDVQQKILDKIDFAQLKVFVVWFPLFQGADNREAALRTGATFTDPRVSQFWLPDWTLGNLYGKVLPFPPDYKYQVAVDVYLIFDEKQTWGDEVPKPVAFMHRLGQDERLFNAETLRGMLESQIQETVARNACNCTAPPTDMPAKPPL